MRRFLSLLVTLLVLGSGTLYAQTKQVSGKVFSAEDKNPIPGVSVFVKGASGVGTTTNLDGQFTIKNLPANAKTLVFRFVGFESQEVTIKGAEISVTLNPEAQKLEEVVVTALGIKRDKKALGYSVTEVKSDDILRAKESNIISALSGKVAGVQINTTSGQPGSSARIVIRGASSITGQNQPLFIIDGVPFENSESSMKSGMDQGGSGNTGVDIDPNNIESMSILKGASASALYGSAAANGAVIITTKSGKKGQKAVVSVSQTTTFEQINETPLQNTWAQGDGGVYADGETKKTSASWGPKIDGTPAAKRYNRWDIFKVGVTNETAVSIKGGTDKASYYLGLTNYDQNGTLEPQFFKRKSLLFKASYDITDKLTLKAAVGYTKSEDFRLFEGNGTSSIMNTLLSAPQTYNLNPGVDAFGVQRIYRASARNNPYWLLQNSGNPSSRDRFNNSLEFQYKFNSKLNVIYRIGQDFYASQETTFLNSGTVAGAGTSRYTLYNRRSNNINSDLIVQYNTKIADDFNVDALVGQNIYSEKVFTDGATGDGLLVPSLYKLSNCSTIVPFESTYQKRKVGVYANVVASYKSLLYYTFTARNDWSSTLPVGKNSYFYPSHSLGFLFSELVPKNSIFTFGKINVSYAIVGNDAGAYNTSRIISTPGVYDQYRGQITFPFRGLTSFVESVSAYNDHLKNELITEKELGVDLKFFNNRLGIVCSVYQKNSTDNIMNAPIDQASGYDNAVLNIGKMVNRGIELQVSGAIVKTKDIEWDLTVNYSKNKSKVEQMATGVNSIQLTGFTGAGPFIMLNQPYPVLYGTKFERDLQGNKIVDDATGQWLLDKAKPGIIGTVEPKWQGGVRSNLTYKGVTLSAFMDIKVGGQILNLDEHYLQFYGMSVTTEDRPESNSIVLNGSAGHYDANGNVVITSKSNTLSTSYSSLYRDQVSNVDEGQVQGAGFIKLREVSLSYNLPKSLIEKTKFFKAINLSVAGRNLWMKHDSDFTGADPEGGLGGSGNGQGLINYMMPSTKAYAFSVKFEF